MFFRIHNFLPLVLVAGSLSFSSAGPLSLVAAGEWFEVSNSKLEVVKPNPLPPGYFAAIMQAWNGGTYDSKRNRLLIWGGGHSDYAGNELYSFGVDSLRWSRINNPSDNVGGDERSGLYPDGTPRSQHTYDHIVYVPPIDRFCSLGAGGTYPGGQIGHQKTMCFDFATKTWQQKANTLNASTSAISAYDADTRKVWMHGTFGNASFLSSWDPEKDVWSKHASFGAGLEYYFTAAAGRGKFLAIGNGQLLQWDLNNPNAAAVKIATTGDTEILSRKSPGFTYNTKSGHFLAWSGGTAVYALDLDAKRWIKLAVAPTNKVTPSEADPRGTYGRFDYVPSEDAVIGVNATSDNVYMFKLPFLAPLPVHARPAIPAGDRLPSLDLSHTGGRLALTLSGNSPLIGDISASLVTAQNVVVGKARGNLVPGRALQMDIGAAGSSQLAPSLYLLRVSRAETVLFTRKILIPD